jgi:hypothetical protein
MLVVLADPAPCAAPPVRKDIQSTTAAPVAARQGPPGQGAAAPNPFAEETAPAPSFYYTTNHWGALGHLLAILAILPATGVAFATTCTGLLVANPEILRGSETPGVVFWLTCCGSAVVVFAVFGMLIVSLRKKTIRRVEL